MPSVENGGSPEPRSGRSPKVRKRKGTVKFFNTARGYGFVEHHGGQDLFVHHSQVVGDASGGIAPGSTVEFTIGAGRKGDEAHNVKVLSRQNI
jgi:cold shock protein